MLEIGPIDRLMFFPSFDFLQLVPNNGTLQQVLKKRLVEVGIEWYDDPEGLYSNEKKNLTPWDMMEEEDQLGGEINDKAWGDEEPEKERAVWLKAMITKGYEVRQVEGNQDRSVGRRNKRRLGRR